MIDQAALRKLEFEKVLERIAIFAHSDPAKDRIRELVPLADAQSIKVLHRQVSETKELITVEGSLPFGELKDIGPALKKLSVEHQVLSAQELLDVAAVLRTSRSLHGFLIKRRASTSSLAAIAERLLSDKIIEYNISQALDEHGAVKDSASKELRAVRNGMAAASDALRRRLNSILRGISDESNFLQDEIITTRDGRLVIPIKTEFKNRVPGFIHSSSASGSTVYIEPAESLDLNNNLRELQIREQQEILRILHDLTEQVAAIRSPLEASFEALVELDMISAKARYSIDVLGFAPAFADVPRIDLRNARHPVLLQQHARSAVIPLDISMDAAHRTLVITGPNAGGKTVTLKTVGLLCLCAMAGIHIPASPESVVYPFDSFFVDIGDDQSLEQDLSTFSSHLAHLKFMLQRATSRSLVLLDEIGSGTDPAEGGGLAIAFLEAMNARGLITIATTHHGALKAFAHETEGVLNGSMEFDQKALTPTYQFRMGTPGSSYAFELAERIGLPARLLDDARKHVGEERMKLESLILHLEQQSQEFARRLEESNRQQQQLEVQMRTFEQKNMELRREVGTIRKKAAEEVDALIQKARAKIEETIRAIRESNAGKESVQSARQALKSLNEGLRTASVIDESQEGALRRNFRVGESVRLRDGKEIGEIVELSGSKALVAWGPAKLRVSVAELCPAEKAATGATGSTERNDFADEGKNEIDLRGLLGAEAIAQAQSFLDKAYVAGLHRVDIIHGKGTGALRSHVASMLKEYPHIRSFRLGEWNEGGTGVTVVEFE